MTLGTTNQLRELLGFITPDEFRQINLKKSRAMTNKVMDIKSAINKFVKDGNYLGIGGFGMDRIPSCALHEIVRQKKKHLTLAGHTATHDGQILFAGGCIDKVDAAYVVGVELLGLSPNYRRAFQEGKVQVTEWTNATLAWRYKAASMGIPFLPVRTMLGTETIKHSRAIEYICPFTGETYALVPACFPDVSIIHVPRADIYGNCQIDGITVSDSDLARASRKLIITTEEIIPTEQIRANPEKTIIPYYYVDAVVHIPFGSFPGNMPGKYYLDIEHLNEWNEAEKDPAQLEKFMDKYIYGIKDWNEYIERCGGKKRLGELKSIELLDKECHSRFRGNDKAPSPYNMIEFMICAASRVLEDNKTAVVGTGLPMLAAMLAQKTHAPNLLLMFEAGGIAPLLPALPMSVGDSRTHHKSLVATSMPEIMETCARGMVDYAFLGGAQIDKYGNLNSTIIGNYEKPKVRLPGSGGANDLASLCWNTIIIMKMDKHKFVEKLDFMTTPGYLTGAGSREKAGLPPNAGPFKVITDFCVLGFDKTTKEMQIESLHPGVTFDDVQNRCSFKLKPADDKLSVTKEPTQKELEILRKEIDPRKQVIGK
jgi:acyl CoA:acetate/3-ketoacid CoA transferase alpha subunit/acyl CoA:acetate/3-ketoacid CoA transferase beta subunit